MTQPTTFSWTVALPVTSVPGPASSAPFTAPGALGCAPCFVTQADLLALMDRLLPPSWLDPIRTVGPGYEILQALAKTLERVSLGVGRLECGQFILSATGGSRARARVVFYRAVAGAAVRQLAGTVVSASAGGQRFRLLADVSLGPSDTVSADAQVEAEVSGYEYDVVGQRVTARAEVVAGSIDTIDLPLQDPPYGDPGIRVQQLQDASGGAAAALDALGVDRGLRRAPGEADGPYAARVRALTDTVTPAAMRRAVAAAFAGTGVSPAFIETWDVRFQTCWNAPAFAPVGRGYSPTTFVWNDPRPSPPFRDRWLSEDFHRGAFVVAVPRMLPVLDYGGVWDDVAEDAQALINPHGRRAASAWNLAPGNAAGVLPWVWNGHDVGRRTLLRALSATIRATKPAGAATAIVLTGD